MVAQEASAWLLELGDLATLTGAWEMHWVSTELRPLAEMDHSLSLVGVARYIGARDFGLCRGGSWDPLPICLSRIWPIHLLDFVE